MLQHGHPRPDGRLPPCFWAPKGCQLARHSQGNRSVDKRLQAIAQLSFIHLDDSDPCQAVAGSSPCFAGVVVCYLAGVCRQPWRRRRCPNWRPLPSDNIIHVLNALVICQCQCWPPTPSHNMQSSVGQCDSCTQRHCMLSAQLRQAASHIIMHSAQDSPPARLRAAAVPAALAGSSPAHTAAAAPPRSAGHQGSAG